MVHAYYSRSEALKNGWYEARTRCNGRVRVTSFNVLRTPDAPDIRYAGLIKRTGLKPMGKLARDNKHLDRVDIVG